MVHAFMKVTSTKLECPRNNPFYGKVSNSKVEMTESFDMEKYDLKEPPQSGCHIRFKSNGYEHDLYVSRYYFSNTAWPETISAVITITGHIYEVMCKKDKDSTLVAVYEWFDNGDFEDENDADNEYKPDEEDVFWEPFNC